MRQYYFYDVDEVLAVAKWQVIVETKIIDAYNLYTINLLSLFY